MLNIIIVAIVFGSIIALATLICGTILIIVKTDGELLLMNANKQHYDSLSRHRVTNKEMRPLPALANGHLFVRDTNTLFCLKVGE